MNLKIADCRRAVGRFYDIPKSAMLGRAKPARIAVPRMMAMTLAREFTGASLPKIGFHFGGRDHTTALHATRRVRERERRDDAFRGEMEMFRRTLAAYRASAHLEKRSGAQ